MITIWGVNDGSEKYEIKAMSESIMQNCHNLIANQQPYAIQAINCQTTGNILILMKLQKQLCASATTQIKHIVKDK